MAKTYKGTGAIASANYADVKWVGKTKGGQTVEIELTDAINLGNLEWTFAEKNDTVPSVTFTATYSNTDAHRESTAEPWEIKLDNVPTTESAGILLGAGVFYIGSSAVALTRGGGSFNVEREFREINADDDFGPVKDRIIIDGSRATLTMNVLTFLTRVSDIYAGVSVTN